jgi:hypothetical protein
MGKRKYVMKIKNGECTKRYEKTSVIYIGEDRKIEIKTAKITNGKTSYPKRQRQIRTGERHIRTGRAKPERDGGPKVEARLPSDRIRKRIMIILRIL